MDLILFRNEASKYFHNIKIEGTKDATDRIKVKNNLTNKRENRKGYYEGKISSNNNSRHNVFNLN